ncbi:MAG: hypothetical protein M0P22_11675, partial [Methanoculleus sp.]|nr:hypothetical protein [Methanoculleus sp.]
ARADVIRALERKLEWYRSLANDLKRERLEGEQQQASVDLILKSLGGDWDEERITWFDTSVPALDDAKQLRGRLTKSAESCTLQQSLLEVAEKEAREKRERLRALQGRRGDLGDAADPETARERLGRAREMVGEIQRLQELETRLHSIRQEEARTTEIKNSLAPPPALPSWPGILVALSAVLVTGWGYLTGTLPVAGVIAVVLFIAAAGMFFARARGSGPGEVAGRYEGEGETLAAQRREVEHERSEREEMVRSRAAQFGFDALPSRTAAEGLVHALEDAVIVADQAEGLAGEIARAEEVCNSAGASLQEAREALQEARSEREGALAAWRRWCRERDLPEMMNPDLIPDLIADIRRAAGLYAQIRARAKREATLSGDILSFEEGIAAAAGACNEPVGGSPETVLEGLVRLLRDEEETKRRFETLVARQKEESEALQSISARSGAAKAGLRAILEERGAATPEEFRELERLSRERRDLEKSILDAESAIRRISGEERYPDFIAALQGYDPIRMQVHLQEREDERTRVQDALKEDLQAIGTLQERCAGIEGDRDLTLLLSRAAALEEEINQASRQWAVYTAASSLLDMAVETFERERQPEILRQAQSFFTGITGGRYTRVVMPFGGSELYVEETTGARKMIDDLSRGTAEQLYLALRFGYIRDSATSPLHVPVVFDDILVNFDPLRRRNACRAIADLTGTCQVLYFTCHPETVRDLTDAIPDAVVMDLSAG